MKVSGLFRPAERGRNLLKSASSAQYSFFLCMSMQAPMTENTRNILVLLFALSSPASNNWISFYFIVSIPHRVYY